MGEVCRSLTGPPPTCGRARMGAAQHAMTTLQAHPQEPQLDTRYGASYSGDHEGSSYYPSVDAHKTPVSCANMSSKCIK
jgi:hypothetical protein